MWHGPSAEHSNGTTLVLPTGHHQIRGKSSTTDVTSEFLGRLSSNVDVMAITQPSIQQGLNRIFKMGIPREDQG
jgi:hypothetical protein